MIKFSQKEFGGALLNAGFIAMGHVQNKKAEEAGNAALKQNEKDFKEQMKQREEAFNQQIEAQKTFGALLGTAAMVVPSIIQGNKSNKIAEQQGEAQMKQQEKFQKQQLAQNEKFQKQQMDMEQKKLKMQNKAIKTNAFTGMMAPVGDTQTGMFSLRRITDSEELQKEFAVNGKAFGKIFKTLGKGAAVQPGKPAPIPGVNDSFINQLKGLGHDVKIVAKEKDWGQHAANMAAQGVLMGGLAYGVDKVIQHDSKKIGMTLPEGHEPEKTDKEKRKDLLFKGALLGTGAYLIGKGKFGSTMKTAGQKFKKGLRGEINPAGLAMTGVFVGLPAIGYLKKRKDFLAQQGATTEEGTPEQRSYARVPAKAITFGKGLFRRAAAQGAVSQNTANAAKEVVATTGKMSKRAARKAAQQTAQQTAAQQVPEASEKLKMSGGAKVLNFFGMGAGRQEQAKLGNNLLTYGDSGSNLTQKVGNFLAEKPGSGGNKFVSKAAKTAAGFALGGVVFLPFTKGEAAVKKVARTVDKNAFKYEDSQNQEMEQ